MIFRGGAWTITVMQLSIDATSLAVYSFHYRQLLTPTILSLELDIPLTYTNIQLEMAIMIPEYCSDIDGRDREAN